MARFGNECPVLVMSIINIEEREWDGLKERSFIGY